ncbi:MAG: ferredoxin [Candidatus Margulisiibacteriota bacterium]
MIKTKPFRQYKILDHCIACTTCSSASPHVFTLDLKNQIAIIKSQPQNLNDDKKSFSALKSCPVSAIGVTKA